MLNNILNLDGVSVLDKKQQKKVHGGIINMDGYCNITYFQGGIAHHSLLSGLPADGPSQTHYAEEDCAIYLNGGADRCFYDCSYDGIG